MKIFVLRVRTLFIFVLFFVLALTAGITTLAVRTGADEKPDLQEEAVDLPIIMYHSILNSEKSAGKFVITPEDFENDLKMIRERGYETITMQQLIDYVESGTPLPEKPIMLTFDDGYYNNYYYAFPLLKQYNMKAVLSIIGRYTDEYSKEEGDHIHYSHVKWSQINEMMQSGLVEIQNHTYNMHTTDKGRKGTQKKKGESLEQYRQVLWEDIGKLQQEMAENTGYTPTTFTYPFGFVSEASFDIIKEMGFRASLSCQSGINHITRNPEDLYMLKRYLRIHGKKGNQLLDDLLEKPD